MSAGPLIVVALVGLALLAGIAVLVVLLLRAQRPKALPGSPPPGGAVVRRQDPFADTDSAAGDPRTIKVGDMIEYLGSRYFVRGSLRLREGGFTWSEHFLDDIAGTRRWISVEEDPDLEVVLWTEHDKEGVTPDAAVLAVDGVEYRRDEQGTASYEAEGATGVGTSGTVEYIDYAGPDGRYLGFERFSGGAWECGVGERIPSGSMTIYPASDSPGLASGA